MRYTATLTAEGFQLSYNDSTYNFLQPDAYSGETFRGNGLILFFNGKSNVGFGEATLTGEGETVYEYRILEDGSAELLLDGVVQYSVSKDSGEYLVHALNPKLVNSVDLLIDGPFIESELDTDRVLLGSKNKNLTFITDRYESEADYFNNPVSIEEITAEDYIFINGG